MSKPVVLVVDDQPEYARLISLSLSREGFEVRTVRAGEGGEQAIDRASELHPDVVLLDTNLPHLDGFALMVELRQRWPVPIILMTANATLEQRRSGLDRGADDYVTKPFSPQELAARVRAVLRGTRRALGATQPLAADGTDLKSGERLPTPTHKIGRRTTRILELLVANPDKVIYRDELLAHAFGPDFAGDSDLLQEEIRRLRRALDVPAGDEGPIRTVRGVGYVFDAADVRPARRSSRGKARGSSTGKDLPVRPRVSQERARSHSGRHAASGRG